MAAARPEGDGESAKDKYLLSSVNNTLSVLDVVAEHGTVSLADLQRLTGFDKTSLFRMAYTLERNGFLAKGDDARYSLGTKLLTLGSAVVAQQDIVEVAGPFLFKSCQELGVSVHLGQLSGGRVVTTAVKNPPNELQVTGHVGMNARAFSTAMGRAILANLPAGELENLKARFRYVAYTDRSIMDNEALDETLEQVRRSGYATDINDRYQGFGALGSPIFDFSGRCVAAACAVSVAGEIEAREDEFAAAMKDMTAQISAALGYGA